MNEFVEECRREWRRLGVPDPIANEMAADLTADIEEAEAEGGSAEDVLGNSVFDPRRFAAAWAGARGVTAPPTDDRPPRRWPVLAVAGTTLVALMAMAAAVLVVGRHGVAVAAQVRRVVPGSGSIRLFRPVAPPFFAHGPTFAVQNIQGFGTLIVVGLMVGVVALGLVVLFCSPWLRGRLQSTTTRLTGRDRWPGGSGR